MIRAAALALALLAAPAHAVQPDEVLADPALEARARAISTNLRCLVCRNESIDESNAPLARDLRLLVRERLLLGETDAEVLAYIVRGDETFAGYGEYVLLRPTATGSNLILWVAGPAMLILGLGVAGLYLRRRRMAADGAPALTEAERARLAEILRD
ncbi:MAG: cytochrome c-type biogenesis protein [Gemmobacter sp.]